MFGAGDVRIEDVPDATIKEPTDALLRITRACICGSDLWPYKQMERSDAGRRMGHEFIGVVEDVGPDVRTMKRGDLVVAPFAWSDGTCVFCREGLHTSCLHGGFWGGSDQDGGQGEAVRVPLADGTLVVLPVGPDDTLMPSLLTLSDVMGTGHHAARAARVGPGRIVAVVGDGAVGLCGVIAAKRLGAEQIVILGRHADRVALAREFGATDVVLRVTRACICGSDLWPYTQMEPTETGRRMGHEFIGIVEDVGSDVRTVKRGDLVLAPFAWSDGTCEFCLEGLQTSCLHGGFWGGTLDGGQGEAVRVPQADGTLVVLPVGEDDALMPSLLTLSDVMGTGHHAARAARVCPGKTVAVVGDGAVGICGVIAAKRLGAERIILLGRHPDRIALGRDFGATDVVSERGDEGIERVRELTGGLGAHSVLECVGHDLSMTTALGIVRAGGAVGRVGVPQHEQIPTTRATFFANVTISGGPAPARAYIEELLPDVLDGRIEPGRVLDRAIGLEDVPDGYRAMNDRESIKVMVTP